MQETLDPTAPSVTASAPVINIDLGALARDVVSGFRTALEDFTNTVVDRAAQGAMDPLQAIWNDLWNSPVNVFATPRELVTGFPPVIQLYHALTPAAYGLGFLAVCCLGLLILVRPFIGNVHLSTLALNTFMGMFLGGSGWIIADSLIVMVGTLSRAGGRLSLESSFGQEYQSVWISAILILIAIFFAMRLGYRMVYRLVLLGFMAPFSWLFGMFLAIPILRPLASMYWWTYAGWAAGGFLAVIALSVGFQMAVAGGHGIWSAIWGIAVLGLAHDLVPWLARGGLVARTPGLQLQTGVHVAAAGASGGASAAAGAAASAATGAAGRGSYGYR